MSLTLSNMTTRSAALTLFTLVLPALGMAGCDTLRPSDEPLPSFDELREEFGGQPPGRGLVREDNDPSYQVSATHFTDRIGELSTFVVYLISEEAGVAMTLFMEGVDGNNLRPGMQFETLEVIYGGDAPAGGSGGRLEIIAVEDGRIAGVFAADLSPTTFNPNFRRLTGGFNAVFEPPEN